MTIILLILGGLVIWAVVAALRALDGDGYGRPEIADRNRRPEYLEHWQR